MHCNTLKEKHFHSEHFCTYLHRIILVFFRHFDWTAWSCHIRRWCFCCCRCSCCWLTLSRLSGALWSDVVLSRSRDKDDDFVSLPDLFSGNRSDGNFADVGLKCLRLRLYCWPYSFFTTYDLGVWCYSVTVAGFHALLCCITTLSPGLSGFSGLLPLS